VFEVSEVVFWQSKFFIEGGGAAPPVTDGP
jgi:hypothetical protein